MSTGYREFVDEIAATPGEWRGLQVERVNSARSMVRRHGLNRGLNVQVYGRRFGRYHHLSDGPGVIWACIYEAES